MPFLKKKKDNNNLLLNELNEKNIKLTEDNNYNGIIIFLQTNRFDTNMIK